jgi:hypothetical protein
MSTSTPHVQADIAISPVRNFGEISEAAIRQAVQERFCLRVLLSYETYDSQWCRLEFTVVPTRMDEARAIGCWVPGLPTLALADAGAQVRKGG